MVTKEGTTHFEAYLTMPIPEGVEAKIENDLLTLRIPGHNRPALFELYGRLNLLVDDFEDRILR